jgi:hypothetical protein
MKYCLKCGQIYAESYDEYENETCITERFPLIEDPEMTEEKFLQLSEEEKDAYELHILDLCRQSGFFDKKDYDRKKGTCNYYLTFRFDKYEELTGEKAWTKENELYHKMKSRERINEAFRRYSHTVGTENTPKCPTCQSTRIHKISASSKVINTALFGLFGTKRHKTFHCDNCGYEW